MTFITNEWTGAQGLIYYGNTLLFVDNWSVSIVSDSVDITNISVYPTPGKLPNSLDSDNQPGDDSLPFPLSLPNTNKPWKRKSNNDIPRKQSQYGAGRINIDSGLRVANITCSGLCGNYDPDTGENVIPRINNYVYMQFTNSIDASKTIFNFPRVLIKEVSFDWNVKNYQRWNLTAISTGDFDIFPGTEPA
jgi:hypothetical protein